MRAYHGVLQQLGIKPHRSLEDDMKLQTNVMSYGGNGKTISVPPAAKPAPAAANANGKTDCGCGCNGHCNGKAKASAAGAVDFTKMTAAQKVAYHKARWDRILG